MAFWAPLMSMHGGPLRFSRFIFLASFQNDNGVTVGPLEP